MGFQIKAAGMVSERLRTQLADRFRQPSNADTLMALGEQVFLGFGFEKLDKTSNGMPPAMVIWGKHIRCFLWQRAASSFSVISPRNTILSTEAIC